MTARGSSAGGWLWGANASVAGAVVLATIAVDQFHKWWMLSVYGIREGMRVAVGPFLDLVFVKNIGISYSMLETSTQAGQNVLAAFAVAVSVALWVWLNWPSTSRLAALAIALVIGGALGNAIDRVRLGGVADFFSLHAFGFYWYVFNIADVAIVAGVALLLYESFTASRNDAANPL
jgi:signal peptidase II